MSKVDITEESFAAYSIGVVLAEGHRFVTLVNREQIGIRLDPNETWWSATLVSRIAVPPTLINFRKFSKGYALIRGGYAY